ncbi:MAG: hypothetical protein IIC50_19245 [Planctomycetes bacterium]|nr:hypothetical protein [Planctomycetota bacterium]
MPAGSFYLDFGSPMIDAGSVSAFEAGVAGGSTHVADAQRKHDLFLPPDTGRVDMGYHYLIPDPAKFVDLRADGLIDMDDLALLVDIQDFSEVKDLGSLDSLPDRLEDRTVLQDLNFDGQEDANDIAWLLSHWGVEDVDAPVPNPAAWEVQPWADRSGGTVHISMEAEPARDGWWDREVEYFFDCVNDDVGGALDSDWVQEDFFNISLPADRAYGYRYRVRDPMGNETGWSKIVTIGADPPEAPTGPLTLSLVDRDINFLLLSARQLFDEDGVEYFIDILDDTIPDSGWFPFDPVAAALAATDPNAPLGPIAQFDGLKPGTTYGFRLKARDLSDRLNETIWFGPSYFTTLDTNDVTPPTPNPSEWDPTLDPNNMDGSPRLVFVDPNLADWGWGVTMTATIAVDAASPPVEYFFECITDARFSSGWIIDPTYRVLVGLRVKAAAMVFQVRTRDRASNQTQPSVLAQPLLL